MLYNYLGTMLFIITLWLAGQMVLKYSGLSQSPYKNIHFISIPLGIPICALIADLLYLRMGTSVGIVRIAYGLLALLALIALAKKGISRQEVNGLIGMLVIFNIMLFPALLNGEKYYVHRGNIYDHYFYLSEVVYMSIYKASDMIQGALAGVAVSDVYTFGYNAMNSDRPTAPLLCAVLAGKGWGNLYFQAHLFLLTVWMSVFGSLMLAMEMITRKCKNGVKGIRKQLLMIFLSLLYTWGFWGQIQYDINAWSQLVTMGSLTAFVLIYFIILEELLTGKNALTPGKYMMLLLTGSGLFLIYPENTMLHGAFLVLISILLFIIKNQKICFKTAGIFVSLPVFIVALAALLDFGTVTFALSQIGSSGSDTRQGWASYFDAYWQGYHPLPADSSIKGWIKKTICFLPSLFGMYVITPDFQLTNRWLKWIWAVAIAALGLGILYLLGKYLSKLKLLIQDQTDCQRGMIGAMGYIGLAIFTIMMLCGKYWSAGKLLLYISPYIYLLFLYPFLDIDNKAYIGSIRNLCQGVLLAVSVIFVCCQSFYVGMKVYDAAVSRNCTGYLGNYPSDQVPQLKWNYPYEFDAKAYRDNELVAIHIEDGWYQDYVKLSLAYEGISYYAVPDTVFNRYVQKEIQPTLDENDVTITVEETYKKSTK